MFKKYCNKSNLTIPNAISLARIFMIIPFVLYFRIGEYRVALAYLTFSGISDLLDGIIARKFNQVSELGVILDPIADKLTLFSVMFCLYLKYPTIWPFFYLLTFKEIMLIIGNINMLKKSISMISARWYGKLSTVVFYISTLTIVSLDILKGYRNNKLTMILMCTTALCMFFSFFKYVKLYRKLIKSKKSSN